MTLPDRGPNRQPRRLGLYAPFALLLLVIAAWSVVWQWLSNEVDRRIDSERAALARIGYDWRWSGRSIGGYPFRLNLDLSGVSLSSADGGRLTTPKIFAEANVLSPAHWVIWFPSDITRTTRDGASLTLRAKVMRASLSAAEAHPPRISIEGLDLAITGNAGANPLFFRSAKEIHLHTKAGPNNLGAVYLEADQALAEPTGLIGRITEGQPMTLVADAIFTHASALTGTDWRSSVIAWRKAGGEFAIRSLRLLTGGTSLDAKPGTLTVDDGGRLHGSLRVVSRGTETTTMDFEPTRTLLGGMALDPPPKAY